MPDAPTLEELGTTDEHKLVLRALSSSADIGRAIVTTPAVPVDRLAALRGAFQAMVADPGFIAKMAERRVIIEPATGPQLDAIVAETARLSPRTIELVAQMLKE